MPFAWAERSASRSLTSSSSTAPVTSIVPASASSGTLRPVPPNQRSRRVTARSSRPAAGAMSSTSAGKRVAERLGRPGQQGERRVVARHDAPRADQLCRHRRLSRSHREVVADREDGDVRRVDPADQRHVAEDVRVTGEVERRLAGRLDHEPARLACVRAVERRRMVGVGQRHPPPEQLDAAALVDRLRHVVPDLGCEQPAELDLGDHRAGEGPCQPDGVSDVVLVPVGDEDRVDPVRLELRGGARGIAGQERIDVDAVPGRRVEAEGRMPEPGESDHALRVNHRVPGEHRRGRAPRPTRTAARQRPFRPGRSAAARRRTSPP